MNKKNTILRKLENFSIQNKIPIWPFNEKNAYLVTSLGILYTDIFTLLTSYIFDGDLCLHESIDESDEEYNLLYFEITEVESFQFFNSGLTQKQYYEKYISIFSNYKKFFYSAVLYHLEVSIKEDSLPFFIKLFSQILTANRTYTSALYKDMQILNVFSLFPLECLQGLFTNFSDFQIIGVFCFDNPNELLTIEKNHRIFRFFNMFSFYFSPKFRATCFQDCVKTNSYIPMFLALKIYQTILLFPKLSLDELNKVKYISAFKTTLLIVNRISEENLNKLIEKNWRFHNYE